MANIKSAKKRILVNRTKAARNKAIKSAVKTSMKKVEAAVANKDKAAAESSIKGCCFHNQQSYIQGCLPQKQPVQEKVSRLTKSRKQHRLIKNAFYFIIAYN